MSEPDQIDMMSEAELRASMRELVKDNGDLRKALAELLKESESFTRERCAQVAEPYGNGTDAEQKARNLLLKFNLTHPTRNRT